MVLKAKGNLYDLKQEIIKTRSAIVQIQKEEAENILAQQGVITNAMDEYMASDKKYQDIKYIDLATQQKHVAEIAEWLMQEKEKLAQIENNLKEQKKIVDLSRGNLETQMKSLVQIQNDRVNPGSYLIDKMFQFEVEKRELKNPKMKFQRNILRKEIKLGLLDSFIYVSPELEEFFKKPPLGNLLGGLWIEQKFSVFKSLLISADMEVIYDVNISESLSEAELFACAQYFTGIGLEEGLLVRGDTERRIAMYYLDDNFVLKSAVVFWGNKNNKTGWVLETSEVKELSYQTKNTFVLNPGFKEVEPNSKYYLNKLKQQNAKS